MTTSILQLTKITKRFGGLIAVNSVDFDLTPGRIVSIIGPNGAGKTTLFNIITGIYKPDEGELVFDGKSIAGRRPDQITALGMCRTFQNIRLFHNMTVMENVLVGSHTQLRASTGLGAVLRTRAFRTAEAEAPRRGAASVTLRRSAARHRRPHCQELALWATAQGRNCTRIGRKTQTALARRTDRGHEPQRNRRSHTPLSQTAR